ncbi:hypothetical protein, unlikely [Trypanosoma congolense IL3000]|uniref:Uncharacterized protein n=1 Tax=Trypanosoma congolense (strain IL3000) TaxID=1068625 RepID=F9WEK0_TRYCI|nr:hypothetical protein, unlikely [Trypanosoma congolense IL3000]
MYLVCPVAASWPRTQKGLPFVEATGGVEVRAGACGQAAAPRMNFRLPCHVHSEMFFSNKACGCCAWLTCTFQTSSNKACDSLLWLKRELFLCINIYHSLRHGILILFPSGSCTAFATLVIFVFRYPSLAKACLITFRWISVVYSM